MRFKYLEEKEDELKDYISIKKKALSDAEIRIKENQRFYELLEKSKATPFTEFTPQVMTATDKKKQESLLEEGKALKKDREALEYEINLLEDELDKVTQTASEIKKTLSASKRSVKKERDFIVKKLSEILEVNIADPRRGNLEINELIKHIQNL